MPTSMKSRYTSSNAYRLPVEQPVRRTYFDEPLTAPRRATEQRVKSVEERRREREADRASFKKMLKVAVALVGVFLLCCTLIYRYAVILEANNTISNMQKEYSAVIAQNQSIEKKIDKAIEPANLEKVATQQLGMVKPDASQIIYIDMEMRDSSEGAQGSNASDKDRAALMGTPGTLIRAFQMLR